MKWLECRRRRRRDKTKRDSSCFSLARSPPYYCSPGFLSFMSLFSPLRDDSCVAVKKRGPFKGREERNEFLFFFSCSRRENKNERLFFFFAFTVENEGPPLEPQKPSLNFFARAFVPCPPQIRHKKCRASSLPNADETQ